MLILRYHLCYSIRFKAPLNCFVKQPLKVNLFYDLLSRLASLATVIVYAYFTIIVAKKLRRERSRKVV